MKGVKGLAVPRDVFLYLSCSDLCYIDGSGLPTDVQQVRQDLVCELDGADHGAVADASDGGRCHEHQPAEPQLGYDQVLPVGRESKGRAHRAHFWKINIERLLFQYFHPLQCCPSGGTYSPKGLLGRT